MNIPDGKQSWHDWITSAESSADRFGDRDVVPASMAREIAARLDQCYLDRKARHEQAKAMVVAREKKRRKTKRDLRRAND